MNANLKIKYQIGRKYQVWENGHEVMGNRCFPFCVILYVHSGSYGICYREVWRYYSQGEAFIIPPYTLHSVRIDVPSTISWAHVSFQNDSGLDFLSSCNIPNVFTGDCANLIGGVCINMADAVEKNDIASSMTLYEQAYTLLAGLLRKGSLLYMSENHICSFAYNVHKYIHDNLDSAICINDLAEHFGFSSSSFRKKFKQHFLVSPLQFIQKRKLEVACEYLLRKDISVTEVSEAVGFKDPLYFTRIFTKTYKVSPRQYRLNYFNSLN